MGIPVIQQGNIGTIFVFTLFDQDAVIVDLSSASVLEVLFQKPDRTNFTRTATLTTDGTDGKFQYTTIAGDLDQAGDQWERQGRVVLPSGDFKTNVIHFPVKRNIV